MSDRIHNARIRIFRARVREWAMRNGRQFPWRKRGEPLYRLVTVELLLQRTKAEHVSLAYDSFFASFPSWTKLAEADENDLIQALRPLGLWRRRASTLVEYARAVEASGGKLPRSRKELEKMPGVGQYVASAALLFMNVSNEPLLDAGMARVLERFFGPRRLADIRYDPYLQSLARNVVDCDDAVELNWGILDLGASICSKTKPKCDLCPLDKLCKWSYRASRSRSAQTTSLAKANIGESIRE